MAPHISVRDFIRYPATADPEEPTSTLVLTSSGNRFVDTRILKEGAGLIPQLAIEAGLLPFAHLDWAFAGTSSSSKNSNGDVQSVWKHWIDSRTLLPESVSDSGVMTPMPDGRSLESGAMADPVTGKLVSYEEMWRDIEASVCGEEHSGVKCVVLQMECETDVEKEDRARGMVIRLGQFCQGVVRVGEAFALERWVWEDAAEKDVGGWRRQVRIGDLFLPCGPVMEHFDRLKVGGKITYEGFEWEVVELEKR
ncbi:hypothetical protein CERZMDRAFT_99188 [Cercospora zeae-maydis SCOH1-5]|uniref:Protein HRI1 n=1 Tax=Cercospora zeae-maydis SCOH1-5 TaxID=717836 RepID=A0A6A6FAW1_9PEZI|nr:hypothetical protein CERZMDRAFT_99188 [Cercospora zeae-maydis SCOH1-5]